MPLARRALLDDRDFAGSEPVVLLGCCEPLRVRAGGCTADAEYFCEAAGAAFAEKYEWEASDDADSSDDDGEGEGDGSPGEEYGSKKKGGKDKSVGSGGALKMSDLLKDKNLYELLSIAEGASQDELKKAYRGLCLTAHPDKVAAMDPAEAKKVQERFVQIQEAYEILSEPSKRMQYDSTLDFDESLPKFKPDSGKDFFEVFSEAFKRNARFSIKRPVPELGSMEDEPRVWKRFYDFWYDFQSWRDPVMLAQKAGEEICDLEDAECREERRWMMRENARVAKFYKQEEKERISKLVSLAESFDPRVLAEKEAKQAARKAEAARREEERTAAKRAKDEAERLKREAEEAERAAAEQKRREEKAAREAVKERVKKCRQRLRSFHPAVKELVLLDQLNEVCLQLQEEQLQELGDKVEKALASKKDPQEAAAALMRQAMESIGLRPVAPTQEDEASTSSGPASQEDDDLKRQKEEERLKKAKENEAKRKIEEEKHAAERAAREAEKAEERKKKEEQKKKEQAAAEAAKRQQEKKEEQKAKKQEEKLKKQEEQESLRKEQQKEEAKQRALEQAEQAKAANLAKQQEMETERQVQLYSNDRVDRLNKLDPLSDEQLTQALRDSLEADAGLAGALKLLRDSSTEEEVSLDRVMALVSEVSAVWSLGLEPPAEIRPPNEIRNRAKTARKRLRKIASAFASSCDLSAADPVAASDWQRGIADGSRELPTWSAKAKEDEKAVPAASPDSPTAPGGKKKKKQDKTKEENLDELLAEFGMDSPAGGGKKSGKKKK
eukprot:TRINITY_DN41489_c0_g1_i1.p1 TRINITY_DN41489_c0_g1~~TRINITY_DN41489_c0_g1_i1.p1  ORF type:complete len:783 (-),score=281.30 TRINITY_DN41489_c0_g1_i1:142-2490(-)